ncbi:AAA family ATPase [Bacillus sp. 31A1R]|uniref:AAA family ATPase n=1 Tax=Robertmurraya mangrovi TaxID=3098077 RepID=A0ABU5J002_9BACI|nr:AAA family ATPase [Bacillus sp. 31A1R]MDZ5472745.1 AAA family ATPase [Bacillus sp. 31A1R]
MNQQGIHNSSLGQKLQAWEKELDIKGFIQNDGELFEQMKKLDENSNRNAYSKLLTIAALSRMTKNEKKDSLVIAWIEKAIRLDPNYVRAAEFLAQFNWKKKKDLLSALTFPTIRETDNRPAKKKTAETMIQICKQFLIESEAHLDELEHGHRTVKKLYNLELERTYESLIELLESAMEETGALLKSAEEYEQSISGVFYTSTHFQEMKTHLDALEDLKKSWANEFREEEETKVVESPLSELDRMIGLREVKKRVNDFYHFLKYQKERKSLGFQTKDGLSLNMVLTGNPGTGKTTLARLFAKIYHELGVLPREEVIEADRSQLVGAFVGQTEENVRSYVEKALGGVLFIDEAYSLKREGQTGNDYGQTAIDTLVSLMTGTEFGGKFAVILAGYPEEMRQFLDANPGLRSRFPQSNLIHLENYTTDELVAIGEEFSKDNDYILTESAKIELERRIERERVDDTFGNARTVKNIVLDAIFKKGAHSEQQLNILDYSILDGEDFFQLETKEELNPHERLQQLVGLETVKEEVNTLISFVKMQQYRREKGLPVLPIQIHSVFTGNPGTGKTTVAKIYAELLKECGLLKRGHLIVTSRADFVAGYVGQTAIKTKKKIREALGGVLFIDEAYSLLSQSSGDFAKEVIDTLVDEMTKHNENLVVVLAGYPNEMEKLLESNPGLRSRFKKFFHFQDYTIDELIQIMELYANSYKYELTESAKDYLALTLPQTNTSGNGRFATNVMDDSIQAQSLRLMSIKDTSILEITSSQIYEQDIERALMNKGRGEQ